MVWKKQISIFDRITKVVIKIKYLRNETVYNDQSAFAHISILLLARTYPYTTYLNIFLSYTFYKLNIGTHMYPHSTTILNSGRNKKAIHVLWVIFSS